MFVFLFCCVCLNLPIKKLQNQLTKQPILIPIAIVDCSNNSPPIIYGMGPVFEKVMFKNMLFQIEHCEEEHTKSKCKCIDKD